MRERVAFFGEEAIDVKVPAKDKFQFEKVASFKRVQSPIIGATLTHAFLTVSFQDIVMGVNRSIQHRSCNRAWVVLDGASGKELATEEVRNKNLFKEAVIRR